MSKFKETKRIHTVVDLLNFLYTVSFTTPIETTDGLRVEMSIIGDTDDEKKWTIIVGDYDPDLENVK